MTFRVTGFAPDLYFFFFFLFAPLGEHIKVLKMYEKTLQGNPDVPGMTYSFNSELSLLSYRKVRPCCAFLWGCELLPGCFVLLKIDVSLTQCF